MSFNKDLVKECLELEDIYNLLDYLGAEPQMFSNYIVAKTICHHGDTHKLYFYDNTSLFKCYSGECGTFDVFELIQKIEEIEDLNKAVYFIVNFFNLQGKISEADEDFSLEDWNLFKRYNKLDDIEIESFRINKSKSIIDEIDKVLAKHYGFTEEELDFIINYDIKYRMGDELNE